MEDNVKLAETLLQRVAELGKTSFELAKLKALDKTADVVSSFVPQFIVMMLIASFTIFFNLGVAFWLGEILGGIFWGFLVVAGFYGLVAVAIYLFMRKWIKRIVSNYIIKQALR